jgi:hemolysin activation/secretion protein
VPFYERSLLGGRDSLRGFGDARFVDQNKISWTLEERIRFWRLSAFNVNVDFEVTPFYEAGTVFPQNGDLRGSDLHHVFGVGFRSVVRPNVVGAVDLGFGEDGPAVFVKLDYPF